MINPLHANINHIFMENNSFKTNLINSSIIFFSFFFFFFTSLWLNRRAQFLYLLLHSMYCYIMYHVATGELQCIQKSNIIILEIILTLQNSLKIFLGYPPKNPHSLLTPDQIYQNDENCWPCLSAACKLGILWLFLLKLVSPWFSFWHLTLFHSLLFLSLTLYSLPW